MGDQELLEEFKRVAQSPTQNQVGTVTAVSGNSCTVELPDGAPLENVRLRAVLDDKETGLIVKPAVGAYVLVSLIGNDEDNVFVVATSRIESVTIEIEGLKVEYNADGVHIERNGVSLADALTDYDTQVQAITVPTAWGPSGVPINASALTAAFQKISEIIV